MPNARSKPPKRFSAQRREALILCLAEAEELLRGPLMPCYCTDTDECEACRVMLDLRWWMSFLAPQ